MSTIPDALPVAAVPSDDNALIAERREKLAAIRGRGVAFPNQIVWFRPGLRRPVARWIRNPACPF